MECFKPLVSICALCACVFVFACVLVFVLVCVQLLPCWEGGILRTWGDGGVRCVGIHLGNLGVRLGPLMLGSSVVVCGLVVVFLLRGVSELVVAGVCAAAPLVLSDERLFPFGFAWALTGIFFSGALA